MTPTGRKAASPKAASRPPARRREEEPSPEGPRRARPPRASGRAFWVGIALCGALGLGLGLLAWVTQVRRGRAAHRQATVAGEVAALAAALRGRAELPFRPTPAFLDTLADLARLRRTLAQRVAGEEDPDADRQTFLEGQLADRLREHRRELPEVRAEARLADLRRAFREAREGLGGSPAGAGEPGWRAELDRALAGAGLPADALDRFPERFERVARAAEALEEALGLALEDARALRAPDLAQVAFLPIPERTRLVGDGWGARGAGLDGRVPGRGVTFTLEGRTLVHRLLNAGTWSSLARVEGPSGAPHYRVDLATARLGEAAGVDAAHLVEAVRELEAAWGALNPWYAPPAFRWAEGKAFDDLLTDLERDPAFGTPDGLPDPDLWPSAGEIARVKDGFGVGDDLVLLRFQEGGAAWCQVLAQEGFTYTCGPRVPTDALLVLPGLLLGRTEWRVPGPVGTQALVAWEPVARPRVARKPGP